MDNLVDDPTPSPAEDSDASVKDEDRRKADIQFRAVIETVIDGVIVIDERGMIEIFNPAAERLFGYREDEVIGCNVMMLMPKSYAEKHDGYIDRYLDTGEAKIIGTGRELVAQRKNGMTFPMELSVSEMSIGERSKFVGIIRDISERKDAEKQIEDQRRSLLELSTPVIKLWEGIVLLPLVGVIDTYRAKKMTEVLLESISQDEARVAIIDITGVAVMDTSVGQHMLKAVTAASMLGSHVILTGIRPETAQTLVKLGIDLSGIRTLGSLRTGLTEAFKHVGGPVALGSGD